MNIFQDIHTYIVISFVAMCVLLFKMAYSKIDAFLTKGIDNVRDLFSNLEKTKIDMENYVEQLHEEIQEANLNMEKAIASTETEAKKIIEKSSEEIMSLVQKKQEEYELAIKKIRDGLSTDLKNKVVSLVIKELLARLELEHDNREFQNISIENSTKMLEELLEKFGK